MTAPSMLASLLVSLMPISSTPDPHEDLRGIWFHAWTGSSAGTEWALITARQAHEYDVSDVFGMGVSIRSDGPVIEVVGRDQRGRGTLRANGLVTLDWWSWGMSFSSMMIRAPHTDADFPLAVESPEPGEPQLAGEWECVAQTLSPTTGEVLTEEATTARIEIDGTRFQVSLANGATDQGVFERPDLVVFRVHEGKTARPEFASIAGCKTSRGLDVLGIADVSPQRIQVLLLTQTRDNVSDQAQAMVRLVLTRGADGD